MNRFENEVEERATLETQFHERAKELRQGIEEAKQIITKNENLLGLLYDALEINSRIRTHYNYLNKQDSDERQRVLKFDLDEYSRLEEVIKTVL